MNRHQTWKIADMALGVLLLACSLPLYGQQAEADVEDAAKAATFIEFDVPGSACEASFPNCTTPVAINPAGDVTGYYADTNASLHGFLRSSKGTFTMLDPPGAACPSVFSVCSWPVAINPSGAVAGYYCDAVLSCHGFLRARDGTITAFDPPGSVLTGIPFIGGINPAGAIAGLYYDTNFTLHGFLRSPEGTFTSFDAPGAVNGTLPGGINPAGAIAGTYNDANFASHGFLRAADGTITTFDPAGSIYTQVSAINPAGAITGQYQDASLTLHGYVRAPDRTFAIFDVPGSIFQTGPSAINPAGTIVGSFQAESGGIHGFARASDGTFTTFDPPGSLEPDAFTFATGINPAGVITGWYIDPSFLGHGYLRMP